MIYIKHPVDNKEWLVELKPYGAINFIQVNRIIQTEYKLSNKTYKQCTTTNTACN